VKRKSDNEASFQKEIENFSKEIDINWQLPPHKNLVDIVGTAELFSLPYMVMESCDTSLQQYLLDHLKVRCMEASELYRLDGPKVDGCVVSPKGTWNSIYIAFSDCSWAN
jgi:hypothetical protein